jgi:hypothetical protein
MRKCETFEIIIPPYHDLVGHTRHMITTSTFYFIKIHDIKLFLKDFKDESCALQIFQGYQKYDLLVGRYSN